MTKGFRTPLLRFISLILVSLLLSVCVQPDDPELDGEGKTYDGMVRVNNSGMQEAWIKPDINISSYRKILLLPCSSGLCDRGRELIWDFLSTNISPSVRTARTN